MYGKREVEQLQREVEDLRYELDRLRREVEERWDADRRARREFLRQLQEVSDGGSE